jgi:hypothetical protein
MKYYKYSTNWDDIVESELLEADKQDIVATSFEKRWLKILKGVIFSGSAILGLIFFITSLFSPGFPMWFKLLAIGGTIICALYGFTYLNGGLKSDNAEHNYVFITSKIIGWGVTNQLNNDLISRFKNSGISERINILRANTKSCTEILISGITKLKVKIDASPKSNGPWPIISLVIYTGNEEFEYKDDEFSTLKKSLVLNKISQFFTLHHKYKITIEASGIYVSMKQFCDAIFTEENGKVVTSYWGNRLPEVVKCPQCFEELRLNDTERKDRKFVCAVCEKNIDFNDIDYKAATQSLSSKQS